MKKPPVIIRKDDYESPVEFALYKLKKKGQLKSQLIKFNNGKWIRVYWNAKYDGEPDLK